MRLSQFGRRDHKNQIARHYQADGGIDGGHFPANTDVRM
jgi:hypothetical protein